MEVTWGPWERTTHDGASATVVPARVDELVCGPHRWTLRVGERRVEVDEPFAHAVLAAHP